MKIKRILITVEQPDFNPLDRYSAVATVIYSFADLLSRNAFEVYINDLDVKLMKAVETPHHHKLDIIRFKGLYGFIPKRIREIIKDIKKLDKLKHFKASLSSIPKPDIIIGWISYGSSYSVDLAEKWGIPLVSIFDNPINEEYRFLFGFSPFFKKKIDYHEHRMLSNANAIIAYSPAVEEYIRRVKKVDKIRVYHTAFTDFKRMTLKSYDRDYDIVRFVYIGSFFKWHRIEDLLDAFEQVFSGGLKFELYLIGNGPEYPYIKKRVAAVQWKDSVKMTGMLDGAELNDLLERLHVGIVPNALWFQGPVKLFQYSAAQLCIVSKYTPTISALFKGLDGLLFFNNTNELADIIKSLILDKANIDKKGKLAQQYIVTNYSEENYLIFFKQLFADLNKIRHSE